MKGLERITQRIQTDAQGQIEALTAAGRRQAQEITEKYEDQARQLRQADQEKALRRWDAAPQTGGGLILKQGSVECSCTFPEILRQLRQEMSGEVAAILFD